MARIFGPVPSRRLGRSLGIDIIPYKTCTYDCVYCECGATTNKTCERREFYALKDILAELEERLDEIPEKPDHLTLSGSGEPTLYARLGELITAAQRLSDVPVAVITNGSLLDRTDVRRELLRADVVLPSLDTALTATFERMNRPHECCRLESIISGLERFTEEFSGTILLEILLIDGFNADTENLEALRTTVERIRRDSIQLNTAVRPGTETAVAPLDEDVLERMGRIIAPDCEIIAGATVRASHEDRAVRDKIIDLTVRRPCTAEDIHRSLGVPLTGVAKMLASLVDEGRIATEKQGGRTFYIAAERNATA